MFDPSRYALLWLLGAFILTTAMTRTATRYIRHRSDRAESYLRETAKPGVFRDIVIAGIHVHHQVWGILTCLFTGLLLITYTPQQGVMLNALAAAFGFGAALTLDEFAMWLHLEDVYWKEEGRTSISALIVAVVISIAMAIGANPFDVAPSSHGLPGAFFATASIVNFIFVAITILKGKLPTGLIGVFVPLVSVIGAVRLAKPDSWWASKRYGDASPKRQRAQERFGEAYDARWNAIRDLIGGRPYPPEQMRETLRTQVLAARARRTAMGRRADRRVPERLVGRTPQERAQRAAARKLRREQARRRRTR